MRASAKDLFLLSPVASLTLGGGAGGRTGRGGDELIKFHFPRRVLDDTNFADH